MWIFSNDSTCSFMRVSVVPRTSKRWRNWSKAPKVHSRLWELPYFVHSSMPTAPRTFWSAVSPLTVYIYSYHWLNKNVNIHLWILTHGGLTHDCISSACPSFISEQNSPPESEVGSVLSCPDWLPWSPPSNPKWMNSTSSAISVPDQDSNYVIIYLRFYCP